MTFLSLDESNSFVINVKLLDSSGHTLLYPPGHCAYKSQLFQLQTQLYVSLLFLFVANGSVLNIFSAVAACHAILDYA